MRERERERPLLLLQAAVLVLVRLSETDLAHHNIPKIDFALETAPRTFS